MKKIVKIILLVLIIALGLFSFIENLHAQTVYPFGSIKVEHTNGSYTMYSATTSSNVGRGTALLTAFSAASSGDSLYLSNNAFDIGSANLDLTKGCTASISLHGAGKYSTQIISTHTGIDGVIIPANNSITSDLSIIATSTTANSIPWGNKSCVVTNATLRNAFLSAQADGIYFQNNDNNGNIIANIYNTTASTSWDTLFTADLGTINVYDSDFNAKAESVINAGAQTDGIINLDGGIVNTYNTNLTATGGSTQNNAVSNSGTATHVNGGTMTTSGSGTNCDLFRDAGTVSVTSNTTYDSTKTCGTITYINTYWTPLNGNIYNNSSTNVGINNTAPSAALSVKGQPYLAGTGNIEDDGLGNITCDDTCNFTQYLHVGDVIAPNFEGTFSTIIEIDNNSSMVVSPQSFAGGEPFTYAQPIANFTLTGVSDPGIFANALGEFHVFNNFIVGETGSLSSGLFVGKNAQTVGQDFSQPNVFESYYSGTDGQVHNVAFFGANDGYTSLGLVVTQDDRIPNQANGSGGAMGIISTRIGASVQPILFQSDTVSSNIGATGFGIQELGAATPILDGLVTLGAGNPSSNIAPLQFNTESSYLSSPGCNTVELATSTAENLTFNAGCTTATRMRIPLIDPTVNSGGLIPGSLVFATTTKGRLTSTSTFAYNSANGTLTLPLVTSYNGTSTATLLATTLSQNVTGKTAAFSFTTFQPTATTTYQINGYAVVTAVTLDVIQPQCTFTDETGTSRTISFTIMGTTGSIVSGGITATGYYSIVPSIIRVKANTSVACSVALTTGTGSITYDTGLDAVALEPTK